MAQLPHRNDPGPPPGGPLPHLPLLTRSASNGQRASLSPKVQASSPWKVLDSPTFDALLGGQSPPKDHFLYSFRASSSTTSRRPSRHSIATSTAAEAAIAAVAAASAGTNAIGCAADSPTLPHHSAAWPVKEHEKAKVWHAQGKDDLVQLPKNEWQRVKHKDDAAQSKDTTRRTKTSDAVQVRTTDESLHDATLSSRQLAPSYESSQAKDTARQTQSTSGQVAASSPGIIKSANVVSTPSPRTKQFPLTPPPSGARDLGIEKPSFKRNPTCPGAVTTVRSLDNPSAEIYRAINRGKTARYRTSSSQALNSSFGKAVHVSRNVNPAGQDILYRPSEAGLDYDSKHSSIDMPETELLTVVGCVGALCSAYHEGYEFAQIIKRRKQSAHRMTAVSTTSGFSSTSSSIDETLHDLTLSLSRGESVVQTQYDRDNRRFGDAFASGDQRARDALKDILAHVRQQVIASLKSHVEQETYIDFASMQDVSDASQDRSVLVLMQLQQRIITSGSVDALAPLPLSVSGQRSGALPSHSAHMYNLAQHYSTGHANVQGPGLREGLGESMYSAGSTLESLDSGYPRTSLPISHHTTIPLTPPHSPFPATGAFAYHSQATQPGTGANSSTGQTPQALRSDNSALHATAGAPSETGQGLPALLHHSGLALANAPDWHQPQSQVSSLQSSPRVQQFGSNASSPPARYTQMSPYSQHFGSSAASSPSLSRAMQSPSVQQNARVPERPTSRPFASLSLPSSESQQGSGPRRSSDDPSVLGQRLERGLSDKNAASAGSTSSERTGLFGMRKKKTTTAAVQSEGGIAGQARMRADSGSRSIGSDQNSVHGVATDLARLQTAGKGQGQGQSDTRSLRSIDSATGTGRAASPLVFAGANASTSARPGKSIDSTATAIHSPNPQMEVLAATRSANAINPKDLLPNEINKFAGFCKGAWRDQIGDRKKAMEDRVRPGGMYNAAKYWQCRSCKFEGRLVPLSKKENGFDKRVFQLVEGISFRWEFLFKSHLSAKDAMPDPSKGTFGCIFCCVEGRGTPVFEGVTQFMRHLVDHRSRLPTGEVLYRMNCLVGRQARPDEDFDINIVSLEGSSF